MIGIYAIIINDKYYIGQSVNIKQRWQRHRKELKLGTHENKHLQNAYNKYGNPKFEVLLECEKEKLNEYEQYYIHELMTYDKEIGYNKSYGGETCLITEAFKEEYCIPILQFTKYGEFVAEYESYNQASRKLGTGDNTIREGIKNRRKAKGFYFIEKKEYEKNPNLAELFNWKPIIQFDLQGNLIAEYFNIDKALKETNVNKDSLKTVLNGKQQSTNGYIWRYKEDYLLNPIVIEEDINPIIQLNLNGEFIAEYKNVKEATEKTGIKRDGIRDCIRKKQNSSSNYIWVLKEEYTGNSKDYKQGRRVFKVDRLGQIVKIYENVKVASENEKINSKNLISCLSSKKYNKDEYMFIYEKDYDEGNYKIKKTRKVIQLDLDSNFVAEFYNAKEVTEKMGLRIYGCLNNEGMTAGGYIWVYKDKYNPNKKYKVKRPNREIVQLDLNGNFVKRYSSIADAIKETGISSVSECLRGKCTRGGQYKWIYADKYEGEGIKD